MPIDVVLANAPSYIVYALMIAAALSFIGRALSEASPGLAKLFGPLGRRWRERGERRRVERIESREVRHADIEDMQSQVAHFRRRLQVCEIESSEKDEFLSFDAKQHRDVTVKAAEAGCTDMPPLLSYLAWSRQRRESSDA